jgi:hypothetical protein
MSLLWKCFLTLALWLGWIAVGILLCLWFRKRKENDHQSRAEEWIEHEVDEDTGVGLILMLTIGLLAIASFIVPIIGTWQVWGGGDGCPQGQHSVEDGTVTPIMIKGMTYYIPNTVCVLDNR